VPADAKAMGNKGNLVLYLDKDLVAKSKSLGFNLSKTFENHLKQLMTQFSTCNSVNNVDSTSKNVSWCGRRDLNPGSQAWKTPPKEIDWNEFYVWMLKDHMIEYCRNTVVYAKKYYQCLLNHDFSEIRDLKDTIRPNALKAISCLAKYLGVHEEFKLLVKNYSLKWSGRKAEDLIVDGITKVESPDEIFNWIKQVKRARPELSVFMDFMTVTGLRLVEAVNSYNLIIKLNEEYRLDEYYDIEHEALEHFRFKEIFFRHTKKAFISFVPATLIQRISENKPLTSVIAVQNMVRKKGFKLRFSDIRETHGTLATKHLKDNEIDFLHGRVNSSVFMKNYFNPSLIKDLKTRAYQVVDEIQEKISPNPHQIVVLKYPA
jgi:intergrase/recombinase